MAAGPAAERSLTARLTERIRRVGPISVSEYVAAALYDPDAGFFATRGHAGREGDFLTAPEVGPLFGAVIARAVDSWWRESRSPAELDVFEFGAGPGTLARAVLAARPACMRAGALRWIAIETSARQRESHADHPMVESCGDLATALARGRGRSAALVMANELLDNLPFDIVERTVEGWAEVRVDVTGGRFVEVVGPADVSFDPVLEVPIGTRVPRQDAARRWVGDIRAALPRARLVVFDYAATTQELAARPDCGWLRVHRAHDDRGSWLGEPGARDITADVALDQIQADHRASRVTSQATFLREHGIDELVAEGRTIWHERAAVGDLEAMRARSRVREAEALLDPAGMGGFTVLEWYG